MITKFHLKITSPGVGWGIAIMLEAELVYLDPSLIDDALIKFSDKIYLDNISETKLSVEELFYIEKAILTYSTAILKNVGQKNVVIVIHNLVYGYTDYQIEGMYYAFEGWIAELLGIEVPKINYTFNKELNRYVFR